MGGVPGTSYVNKNREFTMFHNGNRHIGENTESQIAWPLERKVTYVYLGRAVKMQSESIMVGTSVKSHLDAARAEVEKLEHQLEVARIRVETLEMVAGPDESDGAGGGKLDGRKLDGVMVRTPMIRTSRSTATPQGNSRAAPGSWARAFGRLIANGVRQFSYDDIVEAALELGVDTNKPSARVRVSKFKDKGYLERVSEGVYKPTKEGLAFFKQE